MAPSIAIFATSHLPLIGGAQIAVDEITRRIDRFEFTLFCPRLKKELAPRETIHNTQVIRIGFGNNLDKFIFPLLAPLYAFLQKKTFSIIWGVMANYGGLAALFYFWGVQP